MSSEFFSAIQQLVRAHAREVSDLKKQIIRDRSSFADSPAFENGFKLSWQEYCPSTPHENSEENFCKPLGSQLPAMIPARLHTGQRPQTPTDARQDNQKEVFKVVSLDSSTSKTDSDSECSWDAFAKTDTIPERVVQGWHAFTYGVLMHAQAAHYVVYPGWLEPIGNEMSDTSLSVSPSVQHSKKITKHVAIDTSLIPESDKQALARQEKSALLKVGTGSSGRLVVASDLLTKVKILAGIKTAYSTRNKTIVLHPQSPIRRLWVGLCFLVFLYELLALTMSPFGLLDGDTGKTLEWCSGFFWTCDIFMNFISGIYVKGSAETRLRVVSKHYVQTWFIFDVIVAACQFVGLLVERTEKMNATISLRFIRIIRSFRIGRIMYWLRDELGLSRSAMSKAKLVYVMIGLYFFVHLFACILYEVGQSADGWASYYEDHLYDDLHEDAISHNYLVCLHWSLSQLQGNVDLYPGRSTTGNLFFVVVSSCCSIVALTFFVSAATDTLSDVRQQRQQQLDDERLLNEFFARHDIDPELKHRANHYLNVKKEQERALGATDNDQEALTMFPKHIRSLLLAEMWAPAILWHPLFAYLNNQTRSIFVKVCVNALVLRMYEPSEDVFNVGERSDNAHVILKGEFLVSSPVEMFATIANASSGWMPLEWMPSASVDKSQLTGSCSTEGSATLKKFSIGQSDRKWASPVRKVFSGHLVSEISLWMPWVHVGDLCSTEHGQCLDIRTAELAATLKSHTAQYVIFASFAQRFVDAAKYIKQVRQGNFVELMDFQRVLAVEALEISHTESKEDTELILG